MSLLLEPGPLPETIGTLAELVRQLDNGSMPSAFTDAMLRFHPAVEDVLSLATWDRRHYTRQLIHGSAQYELLMICYEPEQHTSIHDYDSQMAWIKPVAGLVREERFRAGAGGTLVLKGSKLLEPGTLSYMGAGNPIHRHGNAGSSRAITINLYSRPIRRWRVYDRRNGTASLSRPAEPPDAPE